MTSLICIRDLGLLLGWWGRRERLNLRWYQRGRRGPGGCRGKCAHGGAQRPVPSKVFVAPESKWTHLSRPIQNTLPIASRYFGHSGNHRTTSPMSRWRRKTRNIRWRLSGSRYHDSCSSSYLHYKLVAIRRGCYLPLFVDIVWWFSRNSASSGLGRQRRHPIRTVSELKVPSDVLYILRSQK